MARNAAATTADDRRVDYMRLSDVHPAGRNPKQHDGPTIRASLARFGIADLPVIDERTGRLVSGHGRLDQLNHLATLTPAELEDVIGRAGLPSGVRADPVTGEWLVPVVRGWASADDMEAEAYLVTANSTTMFGGWDEALLADVLTDLDADLRELTGYGSEELSTLIANVGAGGGAISGAPPDREPPEDFPEYDESIPTAHTCPACGYQWSGGKAG